MSRVARALVPCACLAVYAAGMLPAAAADAPPGLTAFGAHSAFVLPGTYDTKLPSGFAASQALSPNLALDSGYDLDLSHRFTAADTGPNPLLDTGASYLALANGGRYAGATVMTAPSLRLRLGASLRSDRLDSFSFAPAGGSDALALAFDHSQTQSLLAGLSWKPAAWLNLGLDAISSFRAGTPFGLGGFGAAAPLSPRAGTRALDFSARFDLGGNWVTNLDYAEGTTHLAARDGSAAAGDAYSFSVAKRGIFGDDALGFSLSRPAPGLSSSFDTLAPAGDLPAVLAAATGQLARETDFQLGYVTSFLSGKVALQTNAAYQVNVHGQDGASAVSVLSRAKINF